MVRITEIRSDPQVIQGSLSWLPFPLCSDYSGEALGLELGLVGIPGSKGDTLFSCGARGTDGEPKVKDAVARPGEVRSELQRGDPRKWDAVVGHLGRAQKNPLTNQRVRSVGGEEEDRTPDLRIANAALSQLSYPPNAIARL